MGSILLLCQQLLLLNTYDGALCNATQSFLKCFSRPTNVVSSASSTSSTPWSHTAPRSHTTPWSNKTSSNHIPPWNRAAHTIRTGIVTACLVVTDGLLVAAGIEEIVDQISGAGRRSSLRLIAAHPMRVIIVLNVFFFPLQRSTISVVVVVPFVVVPSALPGRHLLLLITLLLPVEFLINIVAYKGFLIRNTFSMIHTSAVVSKRSKHHHALSGGAD
jgi:hypothetical protein